MQSEIESNEDASGNVSSKTDELERSRRPSMTKQSTGLKHGYGSLQRNSVEGKLFELDTFAMVLKKQAIYYFCFVITCCLLWPILWIAIPWLHSRRNDSKMEKMLSILLSLSVCTGIIFWLVPGLFIALGGWKNFLVLLQTNQISTLDFSSCFTDQNLLLLGAVFSWIYHEVSIDLNAVKETLMWKVRALKWGNAVIIEDEQVENIRKAATQTAFGQLSPNSTESPLISIGGQVGNKHHEILKEHGETVPLFSVMCVLDELTPGWRSNADDVPDYILEITGEPNKFQDVLACATPRAQQKGITSLDVFLTREQWLMHESVTIMGGLGIVWGQTKDWLNLSKESIGRNPHFACLIFLLSVFRTCIPRLWLYFGLGGALFPTNHGALSVVIYSGITTLCTSCFWLLIFSTVLLEYRRNVCQVTILGALVDPRQRVSYVERFLMNSSWYNYDAEQAEKVLGQLPVLSLRHATNVAAFWQLRDFTVLDRANDRMAMSIFLEILILWLLIKCLITVVVTYALAQFSPFLIVTLYDVVIFGALLIYSLSITLQINALTDMHTNVLVETKQRLVLDLAEADFIHRGKDRSLEVQCMRDCTKLLQECEEMVKECDHRDRILFDLNVTPGKVMSVAASLAGVAYSFANKLLEAGHVERPSMVGEFLQYTETSLLSFGARVDTAWSSISSDAVQLHFLQK